MSLKAWHQSRPPRLLQHVPEVPALFQAKADAASRCLQPFNVLRYDSGQHYDSHYDVFDPESYGPQTSQRVRGAHAYAAGAVMCMRTSVNMGDLVRRWRRC